MINYVMKVTLFYESKVLLTIVVMILSLRYYIKAIFLKEKEKDYSRKMESRWF